MFFPPPPTPGQLAGARALIAAQESDIATVQKTHDDIKALIRQNRDLNMFLYLDRKQAALKADIARMEEELAVLQRYIAPIRRLPFELIAEIAVLVTREQNRDIVSAIESLSMVCKTWRALILCTPRVWTCIPWSNQLTAHRGRFLGKAETFGLWLERSGGLRVDIFLNLGGINSPNRCDPLPDRFIGTFQRHSAKLRSLRIQFLNPAPAHLARLSWVLAKALLDLENLDLSVSDLDPAIVLRTERKLVLAAPRLRSLRTTRFSNSKKRWFPSVSTLGHLHIGAISARLLVEFFVLHRNFPSLRTLRIDDLDEYTKPYIGPVAVVKVDFLSLGLHGRGPSKVFQWLQFPQLDILQLRANSPGADNKAIEAFQTLMKESDPPLRELHLTNFYFNKPGDSSRLIECLREVPILSRLCIHGGNDVSPTLLKLLSKPSEESWICPELTELYIGERLSEEKRAQSSAHSVGDHSHLVAFTSRIKRSNVEAFVRARLREAEKSAANLAAAGLVDEDSVEPSVLKPVRVRLGFDEYYPDASRKWHWMQHTWFLAVPWFSLPEDPDLAIDRFYSN
ncbi:hypothetical protein AURDEDRAFT_159006 [Auricularia subglabra TFB-10046 SS5]|nr:hypothetical protein AURDEDRAFT_159006 [Auricularia subglabra TFB-10046 SS5]